MDNLKICVICKLSKDIKDYIGVTDECYKCMYARKLQMMEVQKAQKKVCKICDGPLPVDRWTYCSPACAHIAKNRNQHWTKTFKLDSKDWKKRFIF